MINYYTFRTFGGVRWTFNWVGDSRKCPSDVAYTIVAIAPDFATKEDAERWVRENLA